MKDFFIQQLQILTIFISKSKLISSNKSNSPRSENIYYPTWQIHARIWRDIVWQIRIHYLQILNMPTRKTHKSKRPKKTSIWTSLITILKRNQIIIVFIPSQELKNLLSQRPSIIKHLKYSLIIWEPHLRKIGFLRPCILPELKELFFLGF